tara:strand:+ start:4413 stop:4628 length:216 start_codon:yes stop_codon:yes gene_type:complete
MNLNEQVADAISHSEEYREIKSITVDNIPEPDDFLKLIPINRLLELEDWHHSEAMIDCWSCNWRIELIKKD